MDKKCKNPNQMNKKNIFNRTEIFILFTIMRFSNDGFILYFIKLFKNNYFCINTMKY